MGTLCLCLQLMTTRVLAEMTLTTVIIKSDCYGAVLMVLSVALQPMAALQTVGIEIVSLQEYVF